MQNAQDPMELPQLSARIPVSDIAIWYKHVESRDLLSRLEALAPEEELTLEMDSVVGRWKRMKTGSDGRPVHAIRPVGEMKRVWGHWYRTRKGETVEVRSVVLADDWLASSSALFSEWASDEDEEAFRDL